MSWIGRAISSVGQYYKEINPATLSGAIDVIVVENKRQSTQENNDNAKTEDLVDLACSPWHVRFGKLSVLRPIERKVRILVNGEPAPFSMKIGDTGEAFFVFETDVENLPEDLQTSPLVSPVFKSTTLPSDSQNLDTRTHQKLETVPDFADLGEPQLDSNQTHKRASNHNLPTDSSTLIDTDKSPSSKSSTNDEHQKAETWEKKSSDQLHTPAEESSWSANHNISTGSQNDLEDNRAESNQQFEPDPNNSNSIQTHGPPSGSDSLAHLTNRPILSTRTSLTSPAGDLMLDMDGYKMTHGPSDDSGTSHEHDSALKDSSQQENEPTQLTESPVPNQHFPEEFLIDLQEDLLMELTTTLLRCSEKINRCFLGASGPQFDVERNDNVIIDLAESEVNLEGSGQDAEKDCDGLIMVECVEDKNGFGRFDQFKIESNGTWHTLEISLFSLSDDDHNLIDLPDQRRVSRSNHPRRYNPQKFKQNRLTFEDFFTLKPHASVTGSLLDDEANYIVKYDEKYILTWDNASTALTSLGICRRSMSNLTEAQRNKVLRITSRNNSNIQENSPDFLDTCPMDTQASQRPDHTNSAHPDAFHDNLSSQPSTSYTRPWTRWWYKNDRLLPTDSNHQRQSSEDTWIHDGPPGPHSLDKASNAKTSPPVSPSTSRESFLKSGDNQLVSAEPTTSTGNESVSKSNVSAPPLDPHNNDSSKDQQSTKLASSAHKTYAKTLRLTSDQLKQLRLKKGINQVSFSVQSSYSGYAVCTSRIFLWEADYKICISDIDGTITKSDALGHVFNMIGRDWTHAGVAKLYTDIERNGYKMMYLTSRAIGQANTTREYLKGINQMGYVLPEGPVIMSPDRLMTSLHREVIMRKPELFKMACLRDIKRLFGPTRSPFYAGFGNRITDAISYRAVDVPSSRIFTIDSNGEVKMELLELAGYSSSYIHMTDLVDQMFPPIKRSQATPEYSDFNYWRSTVTDYDAQSLVGVDIDDLLSSTHGGNAAPLSPTLSSRSGEVAVPASRMSFRLSALSLVRKSSKADLSNSSNQTPKRATGSSISNFLAISSRTRTISGASPKGPESLPDKQTEANAVDSNSDDDSGAHVPHRLRSDSMPGSLPGSAIEESLLENLRRGTYDSFPTDSRNTSDDPCQTAKPKADEEIGGEEDEFPQMDFSSVPYL